MAVTVRSIEQKLLRDGTTSGPVTQEMIDLAKSIYQSILDREKQADKFGWLDFLGTARKRLK